MVIFSTSNGYRKAEVIESFGNYIVRFFEYDKLMKVYHDQEHSISWFEDMAQNWVDFVIKN